MSTRTKSQSSTRRAKFTGPVFVYQVGATSFRLSITPLQALRRADMAMWRGWELVRTFQNMREARALYPFATDLTKTELKDAGKRVIGRGWHHTPEAKARIAAGNRGKNNPNWGGIPEERKARIRATTAKWDRRGINNPFAGRTHTEETRRKLRRPRGPQCRRAMDELGNLHSIPLGTTELPHGWTWGIGRRTGRRRLRRSRAHQRTRVRTV